MDNSLLTVLFALPLVPIFFFRGRGAAEYFALGIFTLFFALPFEALAVAGKWWSYSATPQFFGISIFTLFAYFPWIIYSYLAGNAISVRLGAKGNLRIFLCGIFGSLFAGFLFDPVSVALGYYSFSAHPQIFGVPWIVIIAEAFCVALVIFLFEKIVRGKFPAPV